MPEIDINFLRAAVTLLSFVTFAGIVVWALAARNKAGFDEAAQLPFTEAPASTGATARNVVDNQKAEHRDE